MTNVESRFMKFVDKSGSCWMWTGRTDRYGYGRFKLDRRMALAHRVSFLFSLGSIPPGMTIDHLCRNRACVRPDHLEVVTRKVNSLRGIGPTAVNARKTVCNSGHPFSPENTYTRPNGHRDCRTCIRARVAAYRARQAVPA